jgi:FMN phosphatase YigB (HAD superfamily)
VIAAVFFDVGETIVDETREFGAWADWLGVPRHTFSAVFGAVLARGLDHRAAFRVFRPEIDLARERRRRAEAGVPEGFTADDLYPDARPCLTALRAQGVRVGLAGNQPARVEAVLHALELDVDVIATSEGWGVAKPSPAFFDQVIVEARCPAGELLYVGDRLDNDVAPAQAAGIRTALIRRGPWAWILTDSAISSHCLFHLDSLAQLPDLVRRHNEASATAASG